MDIVDTKIGTVGEVELDLVGGKLVFKLGAKEPSGLVDGQVVLTADCAAVLKLIASKIPGTIDDAIIGVAVAALEATK